MVLNGEHFAQGRDTRRKLIALLMKDFAMRQTAKALNRRSRSPRLLLCALGLFVFGQVAHAAGLVDAFTQAKQRDPAFRASELRVAQAERQRQQGQALWNPTVLLDLFGGVKGMDTSTKGAQFYSSEMPGAQRYGGSTFNTSIYLGASARGAITALAPLYDKERQAQTHQLGLGADIAQLTHTIAEQFLAQSVVERYLDVLAAQHAVKLVAEHESVIQRSDQELNKRRRLGDVSAIDVIESRERLESLRAKRISADQQLHVARLALADLSGNMAHLAAPTFDRQSNLLSNLSLEGSLDRLRMDHPRLKVFDLQHKIALLEAEKFGAGQRAAKVNAIAQAAADITHGNGDYGSSTVQQTQQYVGVQLTVPLSTGGVRSARQSEALIVAERSLLERAQTALALEQELRAAWFAFMASQPRISLLKQTLSTSRSRLEQTRRAHSEGARSTLELMAAEAAAIEAQEHLFQEQLNAARNYARTMYSVGQINQEHLQRVASYLY